MRWMALLLAIALPAKADWYQFTPCGFATDLTGKDPEFSPKYRPAPGLTTIYWWIPLGATIQIIEIKAARGETHCSYVSVNNNQWLVVGTAKEIYNYIISWKTRDLRILERK